MDEIICVNKNKSKLSQHSSTWNVGFDSVATVVCDTCENVLFKNIVSYSLCSIKNVIYNPPATIVIWEDGMKTVVKCNESDKYSKETGLLMCIAKKAFGNTGRFNDILEKWCWSKEDKEVLQDTADKCCDGERTIFDNPHVAKEIKDTLKGVSIETLITLYRMINRWHLPNIFVGILNPPEYILDNFYKFPPEVKARTLTPLLQFVKVAIGEKRVKEVERVASTSPTLEDYLNENKNLG